MIADPASSMLSPLKIALCVGNDSYGGGMSRLPNCVADATEMAACAKRMGFETTLLLDADRSQIMSNVRDVKDRLVDGAINLFYFSGHGAENDGTNYLLPLNMTDSDPGSFADEAVSLNRVMKLFSKGSRRTINILLLDRCRENEDEQAFRGL